MNCDKNSAVAEQLACVRCDEKLISSKKKNRFSRKGEDNDAIIVKGVIEKLENKHLKK